MLSRLRANDDTVTDLTGAGIKFQTSHINMDVLITELTGQFKVLNVMQFKCQAGRPLEKLT